MSSKGSSWCADSEEREAEALSVDELEDDEKGAFALLRRKLNAD